MALQEEFEKTGEYFFRWRSYLPLVMAVLFILALAQFRYPFADRRLDLAWDAGCLAVALLGQVVRFFTVGFVPRGTSGRNTRGQVAETLNTTGMYAVVRNPVYLGNFIIWFGLSLFMKSVWFTTVIILFFTIFYERIIFTEETFLRQKFGDAFLQWAETTPAIIPRFKNWRPPTLPFSGKVGDQAGIRHLFRHHRHLYGPGSAGRFVHLWDIEARGHLGQTLSGQCGPLSDDKISEEKD